MQQFSQSGNESQKDKNVTAITLQKAQKGLKCPYWYALIKYAHFCKDYRN